ncbi:D-ribose pyranase [Allorhodopirellula heiligendammensis]|uniref:D-ribose pyranase n=1 Tax=Allorhodopirellula heiligendammensis TaxID=2714739 RepID=A0A5C6C3U6_9BACT|nr:D-ribose pyranase [Allorhodopirellula heiligendammensis]TWU18762.1 D-ribose pyranase [Allorhodopirellula heiligendammensis]|tara:strand:- start:250 stop:657 length:408 start_codon:yes stop_codon:yes gene_type:complete
MKRTRLLNSELSYEISRIGHTASITLCDAGLPIPSRIKRIDLAIEPGYPSFLRTLDALLSEMMIEEIVVASEIHQHNTEIFRGLMDVIERHGMNPLVTEVSHEDFKRRSCESEVFVRTGECTPYANVILRSGVVF